MTATFTKPVDFNIKLLPLVARNRKILLDFVKSQKLIPAKLAEPQNRNILYSQILVTIRSIYLKNPQQELRALVEGISKKKKHKRHG